MKAAADAARSRAERLQNLDPKVLDISLCTVLDSTAIPTEDKLHAFELIKSCGIRDVALGAFVKGTAPDLQFLQELRTRKCIDENCFAFTELFDANGSDLPGQDLPFGLAKMIQFGIQNAILECDLAAPYINWEKYSTEDFCALVESRCRWVAANLYAGRAQPPASYVNLRDFSEAMKTNPARVLGLVEYLAALEPSVRPKGLLIHEAAGSRLPFEVAPGVAAVRAVMEAGGWGDGLLLLAVASPAAAAAGGSGAGLAGGSGLAHATVLESLAAGCGGVMTVLCEEAESSTTHASGLVDLVNLARLGNKHVADAFDMTKLRAAAADISGIVRRNAAAVASAAAAAAAAASAPAVEHINAAVQASLPIGVQMSAVRPLSGSPMGSPPQQRQPLIPGHA